MIKATFIPALVVQLFYSLQQILSFFITYFYLFFLVFLFLIFLILRDYVFVVFCS